MIVKTKLFWVCLLGIIVAGMVPRFVVKVFVQHCKPNDIHIAREAEKFGNLRESRHRDAETEMNPIFDRPRSTASS